MRVLIRVVLVLAVLLAVGLGGLSWYLPRLVQSDAVRARIEAAARDSLGRDVRYGKVEVGLLPPRLVVATPVVSGAAPEDAPFAEAESIGLQLALAPLLARVVVVDSLVLDRATVRLRRTEEGIELPRAPREPRQERAEPREPRPETSEDEGEDFQLAIRELELRGVRVLLEDVTVSPPVVWDLSEVDGGATADSLEEPIEFQLAGRLASGGGVRGAGSAVLGGGPIVAELALDAVEAAPVSAYLRRGQKVGGAVSGVVRFRGEGSTRESVGAELVLEEGRLAFEDLDLRGRVEVTADLNGPKLHGPFRLDATGARLDYGGGAFLKPAGKPATATGRVVERRDGGFDVEDVEVTINNAGASGRLELGDRVAARIEVPPFEAAGWDALLPSLEGYALSGRLAARGLGITTAPLAVEGAVLLQSLGAAAPRSPPVVLDGSLLGRGSSLVLDGMALRTAGQTIPLSGSIQDLDGEPRYRLQARGEQIDLGALARAFAGDEVITGPLGLEADLRGPLGGEASVAETVGGRVRMEIGRGRLRGVSLLKLSMAALGSLAETAVWVNRVRGSDKLERFYEDEFQSITGTFRLGDGRARTDDLRLVYRHYTADLHGALGLADGALDLTGKLTVDRQVEAALGGDAAEPASERRRPMVIPLARVTGTLDSPRVDLSPGAVTALGTRYGFERKRRKLEDEIDERLGKGSGEAVTDILEGVLGGRSER